jgi:hypothetical protein
VETFVIRLVRGGNLAGSMERGEVHGVLSRVMDGSEHPFGSSYELIELLQERPEETAHPEQA